MIGTAPAVSPISRANLRSDPRNLATADSSGAEHKERCKSISKFSMKFFSEFLTPEKQLESVKAHVADSFEQFSKNFQRRFPGVTTMAELWKSPQLRFTDTQ